MLGSEQNESEGIYKHPEGNRRNLKARGEAWFGCKAHRKDGGDWGVEI